MIDTGFHRARRALVEAVDGARRARRDRHPLARGPCRQRRRCSRDRGMPVHDARATRRRRCATRPRIQFYRRVVWGYAPRARLSRCGTVRHRRPRVRPHAWPFHRSSGRVGRGDRHVVLRRSLARRARAHAARDRGSVSDHRRASAPSRHSDPAGCSTRTGAWSTRPVEAHRRQDRMARRHARDRRAARCRGMERSRDRSSACSAARRWRRSCRAATIRGGIWSGRSRRHLATPSVGSIYAGVHSDLASTGRQPFRTSRTRSVRDSSSRPRGRTAA